MMIFRKIISNNLLHSQLYLAHTEKKMLNYGEFKLRANSAQSFNELNQLYNQTKSQNYRSQAFAIACRNYSRIFRRADNVDNFNLNILLGKEYQNLKQINIKQLNILELTDVIYFLNIGSNKSFFNIQNTNFNSFLNELLQLISQKWKFGEDNRLFSYLSKTARCAQTFHHPLYSYFLKQLQIKINEIDMFDCLSISNFILKGKNDSEITQKQISLLSKVIHVISQNKWINKCMIHNFINLITPINEFYKDLPFIKQLKYPLQTINESMSQLLKQKYKQLSGQQIIRLLKYIYKNNNQDETCLSLIRMILGSIKQDGTTVMDPIFIIRFICYIKSSTFTQLCPQWQERMLRLVKYYFVDNKIPNKYVIQGLCQLADSGIINLSSAQKLTQLLLLSIQGAAQYQQGQTLIFRYSLLYQLTIKLGMYEQAVHIFNSITSLYSQLNEKSYYFAVFYQFNKIFLQQFGVAKQIKTHSFFTQNASKGFLKKAKPTTNASSKIKNSVEVLDQLKKIYSIAEIQRSCNKMYATNIQYLKMAISSLAHNGEYTNMIAALSNIEFNESQVQIIFSSFAFLSIPPQFHNIVIEFMQKIVKSKQACGYLYFKCVRINKNVDMRCSINQAVFFLTIVSKLKDQIKLSYYGDNIIINFLMTFLPQQFIKQVTQLVQHLNYSSKEYQYLYLRILHKLAQKCDNLNLINNFKDKLFKINFTSQHIFNYFCHILIENGLAEKQQLIKLNQKQIILTHIEQYSKQQKTYLECLNSIYKQNSFSKSSVAKLRQFVSIIQILMKQNNAKADKLMKDLIRMIRHINKHKIMLVSADIKNIFMPVFSKLITRVNNYWLCKSFILANELDWRFPQLYSTLIRVSALECEWKYELSAQQFYKLLSNYSSTNKWDDQFLHTKLKIMRLSPQLNNKLNQQISLKLQSNSDFAHKQKLYIVNLHKMLNATVKHEQTK